MSTRTVNAHSPADTVGPTPYVTWVDNAKAFGILLVVLGHVVRGLIASDILSWTETARFVDSWIYAFHMPLFFFLSGLFLYRSTLKPWGEFLSDKLRVLAYPYFIWSTITLMIKAALGDAVNHPYSVLDFPRIFYDPIDQYWFLYALFVLVVVTSALIRIGATPWGILSVAILINPALPLISSFGSAILVETRTMAIYVALGVLVGGAERIPKISAIHATWLAVGIVCGIAVSSMAGVSTVQYRKLLEPLFATAGIVAVISLALFVEREKLNAVAQIVGRHSLEIYLIHTIASAGIRIALIELVGVTAPIPHLVIGVLAGLILPLAVAYLFERIGFQFGFRAPQRARIRAGVST